MLNNATITFIGAGNMAEAILGGLIDSGLCRPEQIRCSDISDERLAELADRFRVGTSTNNVQAIADANVVILAVKPQIMPAVLPDLFAHWPADVLVLSIAAGLTCKSLEDQLPTGTRLVRSMPNTPALVKRGITGISGGSHATSEDLDRAEALLRSVGEVVRVDEPMLDCVTALSGSGPAYIFYLAEHLLRGAADLNVEPDIARKLVVQMIIGAAALLDETGLPAEELRRRVTSKGGTTAAAIAAFDQHRVGDGLHAGVMAAHARSLELSGA